MDKLYQVFISSTFIDLIDERKAVSNVLAKAGYMVAGMELFPATDQQQFDYIKTVIDRSDYYVVVVAGRYGSESVDGLSFTEMEYDYARSKSIPVLAFIHGNPGLIASERTDRDLDKERKLNQFREKLRTGRIVETWTDVGTLCTQVVIAVGNEKTLKPGVGWIRGDEAADPKIMQDLARITLENTHLKNQLKALESGEIYFDPSLIGPSDEIPLTIRQWNSGTELPNIELSLQVGLLFVNLYDNLLRGPREDSLDRQIAQTALMISGARQADSDLLDMLSLIRIRDQFEALGLIKPESRTTGSSGGSITIWTVTEKGRRYASSMRALKRNAIGTPSFGS